MGWGRFWFARRDGVWCIVGPLEDMQRAAVTGVPVRVTKREGETWVRLTPGSVTAERRGGGITAGITAEFTNMPDGFVGDQAVQGDQEWWWT